MALPLAPVAKPTVSSRSTLPDSPQGGSKRLPERPLATLAASTSPVVLKPSHERPALARVEAPRVEVPAAAAASDADISSEPLSPEEWLAAELEAASSIASNGARAFESDDLELLDREKAETARLAAEEAARAAEEDERIAQEEAENYEAFVKSSNRWRTGGGVVAGWLTGAVILAGAWFIYGGEITAAFTGDQVAVVETTAPATGPQIRVDVSSIPATPAAPAEGASE